MTSIPAGILRGAAREVFYDLVKFYGLKPHALLRVCLEHMLDTASVEGEFQQHLAACAQACESGGPVPGCWLEREGGDDDEDVDDCFGGDDCDEDNDLEGGDDDDDWDTNERHDIESVGNAAPAALGEDDDEALDGYGFNQG